MNRSNGVSIILAVLNRITSAALKVEALHPGNGGMTRNLQAHKEVVKDDYGLWKRNRKIFARKWARLLPVKVN